MDEIRPIDNKGISSLIDMIALMMIVMLAGSYLTVYSLSHSSIRAKNIKDTAQDMYAQNALRTLSYITAKDAGYWTVQPGVLEEVSDEDLERLVDLSIQARDYAYRLQGVLQRWEDNMTAFKEDVDGYTSGVTGDIEEARAKINDTRNIIDECRAHMQGLSTLCDNATESLKNFTDILGGSNMTDAPCDYVDGVTEQVTDTAATLDQNLSAFDQKLAELEDTVQEINEATDENADRIQKLIVEARCILNEINVKMDNYVSYVQLGVKDNVTIMDMMPGNAALETVPVSTVLGESLYVEDRLAQSDLIRAGGAIAARIALQGSNDSDVEERCEEKKSKCPGCAYYLHVKQMHYDAGGNHTDDKDDLNDEYVTFTDDQPECDLTGWEITDIAGRTYQFGDVMLRQNREITLHSGNGTDNETDLYWNSEYTPNPAIWNNDGDTMEITYKSLLLMKYIYDPAGNRTEKYCPPARLENATNCSDYSSSLDDAKNQIIQGVLLTLIRKDYRKQAEDSVKEALDQMLVKQGYRYCFKAQTCCETINQVTAGECSNMPDNAGIAQRSLKIPGKEDGEMRLYIWRQT
jgi:hypothetical protein